MINGAHSIIYSKNADADRKFLRDVLKFPNIDVGHGWLIFGLPPAEVAVHPSSKNDIHEFYLMCDDIQALVTALKQHKIKCSPVQNMGWGMLVKANLPGGGKLGIYQPRHERPKSMIAGKKKGKSAPRKGKSVSRKTAKKKERVR